MLLEQKEKLLTSKECIKNQVWFSITLKVKGEVKAKKRKRKKNTEKKRKFIIRNLNEFLYVEGIDWMCICNIPPVLFSKG